MATRSESDRVIKLQSRRIELLEAEVTSLTRQVHFLSSENEDYRRRIQRLEAIQHEAPDST